MEEKTQILVTNVWLDIEWVDQFLKWDPNEFNGLKVFRIPCKKLWLPDLVLYNNAADFTDYLMDTNAMVHYDGTIFWPVPTKLQSTCKVDVTYFPFDVQTCKLKFGSWTYDGFQVDITNRTTDIDLVNYVPNGEWSLIQTQVIRNVVYYPCCPEPFPDVTFVIKIRRRILFYLYNVIFPCVMLSALTLLAFIIPPDSGEKVALGITVLLAFSVFMLAVAENMPETSEMVPLISIYLTVVMAMTSVSVMFTVFVLNLHHRGPKRRRVPEWLRKRIIDKFEKKNELYLNNAFNSNDVNKQKLTKASCDRFPCDDISNGTYDNIENAYFDKTPVSSQAAERISNPNGFLKQNPISNGSPQATKLDHVKVIQRDKPINEVNDASYNIKFSFNNKKHNQNEYSSSAYECSKLLINSQVDCIEKIQKNSFIHQKKVKPLKQQNKDQNSIYEVLYHTINDLNKRQTIEDFEKKIINEWRILALFVDRVLFWIFLVLTVVSTVSCLIIAPLYSDK